ncbi:MAG: hypothetical protein ABFE08_11865 [Armatimonadia bacterium]
MLLAVTLAALAAVSLRWRYEHDLPLMLYASYLVGSLHWVPYRDYFDFNMPGTILAYRAIGWLSAYENLPIRLIDLSCLASIASATYLSLRSLGRKPALLAALIFPLQYLSLGPVYSLQREFVLLVPLAWGLFATLGASRQPVRLRSAIVGVAVGLCAGIKPHSALALPVLLGYLMLAPAPRTGRPPTRPERAWIAGLGLLGFALPVGGLMCWLWAIGAWQPFLDVLRHYLPLYASLTGWHKTIAGADRIHYLIAYGLCLGGSRWLIATGVVGLVSAVAGATIPDARQRAGVGLLACLTLAFAVYPITSGQFWVYQYLPFLLFGSALCSTLLAQNAGAASSVRSFVPVVLFSLYAATVLFGAQQPLRQSLAGQLPPPKDGRVDVMAGYLRGHVRPGDTVQPLDWTGGAVHAMLLTRSRLATPFWWDFCFYHHVSQPYIQGLRQRFMAAFLAAKPRFVIRVTGAHKPWPSGADTTREFAELDRALAADYVTDLTGNGFTILRRRE